MELTVLLEYINMVTLGICLCIGFALKTAFDKFPNKLILLIMLIMGATINIVMSKNMEFPNSLSGMVSGICAGSYEGFKDLFNK